MKKLIKLQSILALLIITFSLMLQSQSYGQQRVSPNTLNPPTNLTAIVEDENDVNLFWNQPLQDTIYLHWDDGVNAGGFGNLLQPVVIDCAAKWDPNHIAPYNGWTITSMRFYLTNSSPTVKLKIWTGPSATEVYSQDITAFTINEWNEITLDNPVTINSSTQLWAGLNIDMPISGTVMGLDAGPAIDEYGNNYKFNGNWYHDENANWNIQIQVSPGKQATNILMGYNVFRDDTQLNTDTWTSTAYVDENMLNGTYDYYVTAVYDDGESVPSDTVEVIIDQPVILYSDSMALVDLYNNCNGPNWILNELWLVGPVNEWYGVTTTGTRVTKLWRQSNNLIGDIPASIGDLTALEELHLEGNTINSVPESIGNLASIQELWLGFNPIVSIPSSIGNLVTLKQLHIGIMGLPLDTLPSTFGNMDSLEWLALGDAGLNSLPDNFGDLTALKTCFLWGNNLTELPAGFGGLESLEYLSAHENQLASLPESFGNMSNLHTLYMYFNELTSLPESFGNLNSLFYLELGINQLTSLPDNFGDLNNLSMLMLYTNQLESLPESFGALESLDSVYLFTNQLTSLPSSFGDLSDMNLLSIEHNLITELPESFGSLATIEEIYLTDNQLIALPEDFGNMPELFLLVISQNNLTTIPESLCDLPSLEKLYAHENLLDKLPVNLGDLETLEYLAADMNEITEIPVSIGNLTNLELISLNHNNISEIPEEVGNLEIHTFGIGDNNISELPSTMFDNSYDYLWVMENELQFGSLEPMMGQATEFLYYTQAMIGNDSIIEVPLDEPISYTIEVSGDYNFYTWYKDGTLMPDQTTNTLYIEAATINDQGVYVLKVNNTYVPDLELVSHDFTVSIFTDIDYMSTEEFEIYPNPANSDLINVNVSEPEAIERIIIINGSGQIIKTENTISQNNRIDISTLTTGIYIVKIAYRNGQYQIEKLVVK